MKITMSENPYSIGHAIYDGHSHGVVVWMSKGNSITVKPVPKNIILKQLLFAWLKIKKLFYKIKFLLT